MAEQENGFSNMLKEWWRKQKQHVETKEWVFQHAEGMVEKAKATC